MIDAEGEANIGQHIVTYDVRFGSPYQSRPIDLWLLDKFVTI